jgi:hypothetical protein
MLDMLWRSAFRWKSWPRRVTGDSAYGTVENIAATEKAGIRAYMALKGAGQGRPSRAPGRDAPQGRPSGTPLLRQRRVHLRSSLRSSARPFLYTCPAGEFLVPRMRNVARSLIG